MLEILETYVNQTEDRQYGDSGWYEPFTGDRGELFRSLQQEFGRCISRVYLDHLPRPVFTAFGVTVTRPGCTVPAGWVFLKRMRYEDARGHRPQDFYLREVWVQLRETPDEPSDV